MAINKLIKQSNLIIVIIDDPHLLELVVKLKAIHRNKITIIFSFHGYSLQLAPKVVNSIDKILFLTENGYLKSKANYSVFTPEVEIVGNGVDSEIFYPLSFRDRIDVKESLGFNRSDVIVTWMANDRPAKGLHLFLKIVEKIRSEHPTLKVVIIGSSKAKTDDRVISAGRLAPTDVAKWLQVSDFYLFTSLCDEGFGLSVIEAYKCGNYVIAADNGGIAEVLAGLPNTKLVSSPNIVQNWISIFNEVYNDAVKNPTALRADFLNGIWPYDSWEKKLIASCSV